MDALQGFARRVRRTVGWAIMLAGLFVMAGDFAQVVRGAAG